MDGLHPAALKSEHTIDLCKHREWILLKVGHVIGQHLLQSLKLCLFHSLNNELLVVAEEKEASTLA